MEGTELMSLDDEDSVVRRAFDESIVLSELGAEPVEISPGFNNSTFVPKNKDEIYTVASSFKQDFSKNGFPDKLWGGVCEAMRNAYQHGNDYDSNKQVFIYDRVDEESARFFIGDEGGEIHPALFPYVLRFRQRGDEPVDFYRFSGKTKLDENGGVGTRVMHLLFDKVEYYWGKDKGLFVYLEKNK